MAYDTSGEFRYKIGWNVNYSGYTKNWSQFVSVPGVGKVQGAGMAIGYLDNDLDLKPDLILMSYQGPSITGTQNGKYHYKIGLNLDANGTAQSWSPNMFLDDNLADGKDSQGAAVKIVSIDGDPRPDIVFLNYVDLLGQNRFRYRVGFNITATGAVTLNGYAGIAEGVGSKEQGAGLAFADLDSNGRPDMVVMAYDNPSGSNSFRSKVGMNMPPNGDITQWTAVPQVPGVGNEGSGAGMDIANIDDNPKPDAIFMAYDNPPGANTFRYRIVWNIAMENGKLTVGGWGNYYAVPGVGKLGQGAGLASIDSNSNGRPELVLLGYDSPPHGNTFRYRVAWDLDPQGKSAFVSSAYITVAGVGSEGQGAGIALANLPGQPKPGMFLMAYDNPPGSNTFRYRLVSNINLLLWTQSAGDMKIVPGVGSEAQGAGIAMADLDGNGLPEMFLMAYDKPYATQPSVFHYKMGRDVNIAGDASIAFGWGPAKMIPGVGENAQGAGISIVNLGHGSEPDMVLMAYVPADHDRMMFRFQICWDLDPMTGSPQGGCTAGTVPGVGDGAFGADLCPLPQLGASQFAFMAYDRDSSTFRYKIADVLAASP
jgi:hypothetical protein